MSEFLKFSWEIIAQVVYNISEVVAALLKLFILGWVDYFRIFYSYFIFQNLPERILSVLLMVILVAIPVLAAVIIVRSWILRIRLKNDKADNAELYREIGRLNQQVISLIDEKNAVLALKVNTMGGTERIPYVGASALVDDTMPVASNVIGGSHNITVQTATVQAETVQTAGTIQTAPAAPVAPAAPAPVKEPETMPIRFPKLAAVDERFLHMAFPAVESPLTLTDFADQFRRFAASQMHLYYTPEIIRRYVAGMASSKLLILEGISGTGKTSLPYAFGKFLDSPATIIPVQPSFRDKTELLGYFNEFSKRFNETEFLRAVYEASWRPMPTTIVLDEMNLARVEYYFAEILSVLEMPSKDEWVIDLVPTPWDSDPVKLREGKVPISDSLWFIGTANNDDSTFTITDKVYDRAMPIELNERAAAFVCEPAPKCDITAQQLNVLFQRACADHPISEELLENMQKLNDYLITRFKLAFGNRIIKQMNFFIPAYVACGGTEISAMDYIIARKVLKKFESMNVSFVRDEITGLINYMDKTFGEPNMPDSKAYLRRIQNMY